MMRVIELFAGVGGFRIGLEGWNNKSATSKYTEELNSIYKVVWGNQWEPGKKTQDAFKVYSNKFPGLHSNEDIQEVIDNKFDEIPDAEMLVGGFPCQDYSVAKTLSQSNGIKGKKGVLWWSIHSILEKKIAKKRPIKYLMLENVDRLLKSPTSQRGRDFAIMLKTLSDLGYAVEWRVINAADYGMPQRRRRVFFMAYYKNTDIYKSLKQLKSKEDWILNNGIIASAFPIDRSKSNVELFNSFKLDKDITLISNNFNKNNPKSPFCNSGLIIDDSVFTIETKSYFKGKAIKLKDIIISNEKSISKEFFLNGSFQKWEQLKGAKKIERIKDGFTYSYSEGAMCFPDDINKPSRTIITGEGGSTPSRFKHVIQSPTSSMYRRLTPVELERLNMFPDNHTQLDGISDIKRAFFMGNALVIGIVEKLGQSLQNAISKNN